MDPTPLEDALAELESADPADAPEIAERIAAGLAAQLETIAQDGDDAASTS